MFYSTLSTFSRHPPLNLVGRGLLYLFFTWFTAFPQLLSDPSTMNLSDRTQYYMAGAIASSTAKSYDKAFKIWTDFASRHGLPLMPIEPIPLGNCLSELADSSGSLSSITRLVAAVARFHWDRFLPSPTENFAFRRLLQGFKRRLSKPPKQKDPLTPEILSSAIDLVRKSGRLQEWRTVVRMCLAFYAGCRWSDAAFLCLSNLSFDASGVAVTIPKSKTDQLAKGETVYIQYAAHPACPVILLQDYIAKLRYGDRDGYLQPRISTHNGVQSGIWNTTVSYSTALSDLKLFLSSLGLDPSKFGEHSGRRGGATTASDAGVDWPDLMTHGRWKSVATPLGYLANTRRRQRRVANALSVAASSTTAASSSTSSTSSAATPSSQPRSTSYFQSTADWVQAKRRYTGHAVSDPIPLPPPSTQERLAAEALASLIDSPPPEPAPVLQSSPVLSVTSSTMDSLFQEDVFELMIL